MKNTFLMITILAAALVPVVPAEAAANDSVRIGRVQVKDYSGSVEDPTTLDLQLSQRLKAAGFETVELTFQPPVELEEAARRAGCQYVLYTEILEVRRPLLSRAHLTKTLHMEVDIEFRLFGLDETFPRVSTAVTGRGKVRRPTPANATAPGLTFRGPGNSGLTAMTTTADESEPAAIRAAFEAAFEKQTLLAAAGVKHGAIHIEFE